MTITLTDTLRPLPVLKPERRAATPKMRLICKGDKAWISVGLPIRRMLDLDPKQSFPVTVLVSRAQIAIQVVEKDDRHARLMSTGGRINTPELVDLLHLKDGERFEIPVGIENGMLVGPMPETVFTRVGFMERKARNGKAA